MGQFSFAVYCPFPSLLLESSSININILSHSCSASSATHAQHPQPLMLSILSHSCVLLPPLLQVRRRKMHLLMLDIEPCGLVWAALHRHSIPPHACNPGPPALHCLHSAESAPSRPARLQSLQSH